MKCSEISHFYRPIYISNHWLILNPYQSLNINNLLQFSYQKFGWSTSFYSFCQLHSWPCLVQLKRCLRSLYWTGPSRVFVIPNCIPEIIQSLVNGEIGTVSHSCCHAFLGLSADCITERFDFTPEDFPPALRDYCSRQWW